MTTTIRQLAGAALIAAGFGAAAPAAAVTITYQASDVADVIVGEDLWQYSYTVSGNFVAPVLGFNVLFSPGLYRNLENPPPAVNAWSVFTVEPDLMLSADGYYHAESVSNPPSLADPFTLTFVWLGRGAPGSQSFEVFDDTFTILQSGLTQAPGEQQVPLPGTLALLAAGMLGWRFRCALTARPFGKRAVQ